MEIRRCTSELTPSSGDHRKDKSLFYVIEGEGEHHIIKLDLSRDFSTPTSSPHYIGRSNATRPQPPSPQPEISLHRCRNRRLKSRSQQCLPQFSSSSFGRFLRVSKMKRRMRKKRNDLDLGQAAPMLPHPYFKVNSSGYDGGTVPKEVAMAALGSKIYLYGGFVREETRYTLPREVYAIDTAREPPHMVKLPCLLNSGKRYPITWTIGGKIYVMPHSFTDRGFAGEFFERFDPESNSWTILPNPPFHAAAPSNSREFEIVCPDDVYRRDPLGVRSHTVLGSTLVISMESGGVYAFDTARADGNGWRRILLALTPRVMLNFLPFWPHLPVAVAEDLVFCPGLVNFLPKFLKAEMNIESEESYVCRFGNLHGSEEIVSVTLAPLDWNKMSMRWAKFVQYFSGSKVTGGAGIGDGFFVFARTGHDYNFGKDRVDKGDFYFSFNLFRVSNKDGHEHEATEVASALFRAASLFAGPIHFYRSFVMKEGVFSY